MIKANVRSRSLLAHPYRWLWRTAFANVRYMWSDLTGGIENLFRWAPLVWHDRWYDSAFLFDVMEYKLRVMADRFERYGCCAGSEKRARQMRICAELCKRLSEDDYPVKGYLGKRCPALQQPRIDREYLGKLLGKHAGSWWD